MIDLNDGITDVAANFAASAIRYAALKFAPVARRCLSALWRRLTPIARSVWQRTKREAASEVAAMRTGRLRRKTAYVVVPAWAIGGVGSYILTGGMDDAAPLWAMCLGGSVAMAFWCAAGWQGWLAVRWTGRRAWGLVR